jgi:thiol-disulfide isomerase/thioredoxin
MRLRNFFLLVCFLLSSASFSQNGNPVLIETFSETGCGACAAYDSAFQAVVNANAEKVILISYHCYYSLDKMYQYNKLCDGKYGYYDINGFPGVIVNGRKPIKSSSHMTYIKSPLIEEQYNTEKKFDFDIRFKPTGKGNVHSTEITVNATPLKASESKDLRLFVVITENNIDYEKRYNEKSVNGINEFNHIMRAFLPDSNGTTIAADKAGMPSTVTVSYTNDDKEINYKEVQVVVFVQDVKSKEVLGAATRKENPFE